MDSGSTLKLSILQLLSGWLGSVRAEESCHKASHAIGGYEKNQNPEPFLPEIMSPNTVLVSEYFP